jgi:hypothetical protein
MLNLDVLVRGTDPHQNVTDLQHGLPEIKTVPYLVSKLSR